MKAETPATGIMKTHDFGHSKFYKVDCECGNEDDAIRFEVEMDPDCRQVIVHTWNTQKTNWWFENFKKDWNKKHSSEFAEWYYDLWFDFWNGLFRRLQFTWRMWVKGYVEYESTTIMTKQQALNYAKTLERAVKEVEQNYNEHQEKLQLAKRVAVLEEENAKLKWSLSQQD